MKQHIEDLIRTALLQLQLNSVPIQVDITRDKQHGDYASNIALVLAKSARQNPRELAAQIMALLPASHYVTKTEIAGPGFINFFLAADAMTAVVGTVLKQ